MGEWFGEGLREKEATSMLKKGWQPGNVIKRSEQLSIDCAK